MKVKIGTVIASILLLISLSGCVSSTNVTFHTDVDDANVYVDGKYIGTTPVTVKMSNGIWEDQEITIKKDGYKTLVSDVKKETKTANIVLGVLINWPAFLWCYGPKPDQFYLLTPDTSNEK